MLDESEEVKPPKQNNNIPAELSTSNGAPQDKVDFVNEVVPNQQIDNKLSLIHI